jgi:hypothetical protein
MLSYFPFYILLFGIYSVLLVPFSYIKGIIEMAIYLSNKKNSKLYKFYYFMLWLFFGILFLLYILMKDIYLCFLYIFIEIERKDDEFLRMTKNLTDKDVVNILKFIHSPKAMETKGDLHNMFVGYLDFEREELEEIKSLPEIKRLNTIKLTKNDTKLNKKDSKLQEMKTLEKNITKNILIQNDETDMTTKIRKNLMMIETLENFVIYDDSMSPSSVNVTKMRKLLPLVYNVKKKHYSRLVYSHVSVLGAISKIKENKINFRQYLLTKQIIDCAVNIDKQIDIEINRLQRKIIEGKKNRRNSNISPINKLRNTFMLNNKGKLIDENQEKEKENKKNIVVELKSVQDFYMVSEKLKQENSLIIKKKNSENI